MDACAKTMTFPKTVDRWSNIGLTLLEPLVLVTLNFDGVHKPFLVDRGGVRSTRGLGPTMTARGQTISISNGMLLQTLIMPRLDQLSRLGARI
jgi:hypothetical protein